ncbi:hypothetical protein LEP1GSC202_1444 [Leptospira yanagawae serovar Saopaulo str. Sao Paulo = ATCC 700523]|uniref:SRPBCC family protein n=2 Tax=Leptospira yanagawae TaxID=293069 RepID=A0ABY2M8J4_9LEPT|nr:hypothetical protein [Leptospira yanagawae]EOQ89151.1 hypothetical protein LEP1GSC202_1444 [Leptospira yanagawae serovar Saopaulo str. Sao Paulo = ATCC 700523]TGL24380.1 hypothetical protein EHQ46_04485 [Leptospira yanagawae]
MIWYLRVFGIFVFVFGFAVLGQKESRLERTWEVKLKPDQTQKILYESFQPKSYRQPTVGEEWESKTLGETVKCKTIAVANTPTISFQIQTEGFKHYQVLKETYQLDPTENGVRVHGVWEIQPVSNFSSKLLFLFFSDADLNLIASSKEKRF